MDCLLRQSADAQPLSVDSDDFPFCFFKGLFVRHRFRLVLLDMEEYKLLNGRGKNRKIRASRYDRIPTELVQELEARGMPVS